MQKLILMAATVLTLSRASAQTPVIEKLTVEPNHSTIGFIVPIGGGMTQVTGKFLDYDLKFNYVDNDLRKSDVTFIIKVTSINTDNKDRDDHLRTADFFDVEKFPLITFKSSRIWGHGRKFKMEGMLSIHGVEKKVTIPLELLSADKPVAVQIRWKINRKEFNIGNNFKHTVMSNFLPDDIDVSINLWTKHDKR